MQEKKLLTPTKSPYKIPANLEGVDKYAIRTKLTSEEISQIWSTKDLLGQDEREILLWYHRLNHCSFKSLIRLPQRGVIPKKLRNIIKLTPCVACIFTKSHKRS